MNVLAADDAEIGDQLLSFGSHRYYRADSSIIFQGDDSSGVFIVLSGYVKVFHTDENGVETGYRLQGPGELVGELALIDQQPRSATVSAISDVEALYIPASVFIHKIESDPALAIKLLLTFSKRIRSLSTKLNHYANGSVYQRLKQFLEELSNTRSAKNQVICLRHRDLALLIGTSRATVSKLLARLKADGYIAQEERAIRIIKPLPNEYY
ncbi:MAG: Crp/Fnr family transcriptional regulator [Thiotrichales bacterium]